MLTGNYVPDRSKTSRRSSDASTMKLRLVGKACTFHEGTWRSCS
jgi:hypothetical protein